MDQPVTPKTHYIKNKKRAVGNLSDFNIPKEPPHTPGTVFSFTAQLPNAYTFPTKAVANEFILTVRQCIDDSPYIEYTDKIKLLAFTNHMYVV